ncbi:competence type IV pilus assembly protein ComGB [Bacillus sp. V5-8f]|uniref:competence type IV pilus assembly protein ComGB n=1 Tax=Bacillus sp. V5-8f TaxID=2053044 RepID=UPI0015E1254C|nr:competence type IV pilus assembly protein ComGB [Bacillus sp. V5-8f]
MKRSKWKGVEQAQFLIKLGELLENGYPLSHAIQFLLLQESGKKAADLDEALLNLRQGHRLHSVLASMCFHPQLVSYIYYGESYGHIEKALKEGGGYWKKRTEDFERIKKLLIYPFFLFFFVVNIFYVLQETLLPKFQVLFQSMEVKENIFLNAVLAVSKILPIIPLILVVSLVLIFFGRKYWFLRICPLRRRKILHQIPFIGRFLKLYDTQFFSSQLSGLLSGGLSINESICLFSESSQPFYQKLCSLIKQELTEGKSLEDIFQDVPYFEKHLSVIMAHGQKYGTLDSELFHYSRYVLSAIEERTAAAIRIIQPLLFSIVGLLIISIYLAVLMPMFSLLGGL